LCCDNSKCCNFARLLSIDTQHSICFFSSIFRAKCNKTEIEIIAGPIENEKLPSPPHDSWVSDPASNVAVWNIQMEANTDYCAEEVNPDQDSILRSGARILTLQGKPINEPVVQHGPFVMNTRMEISQAFGDYQRTQFGGWPWPKRDQVHDRSKGRFARYVDGRIEEKG